MLTMNELVVDWRMQQHFAEEIYRQQILQRIPDPFHHMLLPLPVAHPHVVMPTHSTLPNVEAKLENKELWQQFHHIGTEMIITKTGRRMFPSMRLTLSGLEDDSNYCVLLEMIPIGDCRYKFSGSQWLPAGGAEPQSPQRMFLHPDSPATGAHWQAQPILFNKVKLTNNTLDNNGHMVLASMHKYQPRLHVIRASDLAQMPWAPQKAVVFPETEFIAVTAYQNDRITKLKIDNNPFAKGFRESGQSRCKRKMSTSPTRTSNHEYDYKHQQMQQQSSQRDKEIVLSNSPPVDDDRISVCSQDSSPHSKRLRSNGSACSASSFDEGTVASVTENEGSLNIRIGQTPTYQILNLIDPSNALLRPLFNDYYTTYFTHPHTSPSSTLSSSSSLSSSLSSSYSTKSASTESCTNLSNYGGLERIPNRWCCTTASNCTDYNSPPSSPDTEPGVATNRCSETFVDVESMSTEDRVMIAGEQMMIIKESHPVSQPSIKRHSFSISAILGTGEKDIQASS